MVGFSSAGALPSSSQVAVEESKSGHKVQDSGCRRVSGSKGGWRRIDDMKLPILVLKRYRKATQHGSDGVNVNRKIAPYA